MIVTVRILTTMSTTQSEGLMGAAIETRARYSVHGGYYGDVVAGFATFLEALVYLADASNGAHDLTGEGLDYDCDGDGFYMCSDGLTEGERDAVRFINELPSGHSATPEELTEALSLAEAA